MNSSRFFPGDSLDMLLLSEEEVRPLSFPGGVQINISAIPKDLARANGEEGPPRVHEPHLSIVALATWLRGKGYKAGAIDNVFRIPANWSRAEAALKDGTPVLGISTTFLFTRDCVKRITDMARSANPDVLIVLGGLSALNQPEIMELADVVVKGRGERPLQELLAALKNGGELKEVSNIYHRSGGRWTYTYDAPAIDIDEIPSPDWDLLPVRASLRYPVEASSGCRHHCDFCSYWDRERYAFKDAALVVGEMELARRKYGAGTIRFVDGDFTADPARAMRLCELMIARGLKLRWSCYARADAFAGSPGLAETMREAGCAAVFMGIESGDDGMLRAMGKDCDARTAADGVAAAKAAGLIVHCNFIVGYPGETAQTVGRSISFIKDTRPDLAFFGFFYPRSAASIPRNGRLAMESAEARRLVDLAADAVISGMPGTALGTEFHLTRMMGFGLSPEEALKYLLDGKEYYQACRRADPGRQAFAARSLLATLRRINSCARRIRGEPRGIVESLKSARRGIASRAASYAPKLPAIRGEEPSSAPPGNCR